MFLNPLELQCQVAQDPLVCAPPHWGRLCVCRFGSWIVFGLWGKMLYTFGMELLVHILLRCVPAVSTFDFLLAFAVNQTKTTSHCICYTPCDVEPALILAFDAGHIS